MTNLKYMKRWYAFYNERVTNRQQLADEMEMPEIFGRIPWFHHVLIFSKCHSVDEALFYIKRVVERTVKELEMKN